MKVEPGIGMGISKLAEEFDQFLRENCADKSNVEMLRLAGGGSFSGISCPSNAGKDVLSFFSKSFSSSGNGNLSSGSLKQLDAELFLELPNVPGKGWLSKMKSLGCAGE